VTSTSDDRSFDVSDIAALDFGGKGDPWVRMTDELRTFLDNVATMAFDRPLVEELTEVLESWNRALPSSAAPEGTRAFGRSAQAHGRGQTMTPRIVLERVDAGSATGTVRFGRYFLGRNGAVHGGAIPLMFDEILGRLSNSGGRAVGRTAYLTTNYRSITPVDTELDVRAWVVSEEGRKRTLRAELRHGDVLCADAEGLFVALRPGQP